MNFAAITRRIRRCESDVPAQIVLEHAIREAVAAERETCAKVCDARYMGDNNREDMEARRCAAAIRDRSAALDAMAEDADRMGLEY